MRRTGNKSHGMRSGWGPGGKNNLFTQCLQSPVSWGRVEPPRGERQWKGGKELVGGEITHKLALVFGGGNFVFCFFSLALFIAVVF